MPFYLYKSYMRIWPPNKKWTSTKPFMGYRHFELSIYGGLKDNRWVELFAVNDPTVISRISWQEINDSSQWSTGWLHVVEEI